MVGLEASAGPLRGEHRDAAGRGTRRSIATPLPALMAAPRIDQVSNLDATQAQPLAQVNEFPWPLLEDPGPGLSWQERASPPEPPAG
jgi:hypothetical protein